MQLVTLFSRCIWSSNTARHLFHARAFSRADIHANATSHAPAYVCPHAASNLLAIAATLSTAYFCAKSGSHLHADASPDA